MESAGFWPLHIGESKIIYTIVQQIYYQNKYRDGKNEWTIPTEFQGGLSQQH
ncbi:hypothetical protein Sjap_014892 [Stephania japonica]|uniref:Uncharacterized protein n=1 Tax=Stephania japonica TaxID=461633 RepID=A0AAP0NSC4_9MAGN